MNATWRAKLPGSVALAPTSLGCLAVAADFQAAHVIEALARQYAARCLAALSRRQFDSEEKEWADLTRETMEATR